MTAEDHRFALEVLQLKLRRKILKFIREKKRTTEEIQEQFKLSAFLANFHLALLEKALVIERSNDLYEATPVGMLYLEKVEDRWRL